MNIPDEAIEAAARAIHGYPDATWRNETTRSQNYYRDRARAALEAAWAVMHPVLTTAEELEALPLQSVILDGFGTTWQVDGLTVNGDRWWITVASPDAQESKAIPLPATVIHRP